MVEDVHIDGRPRASCLLVVVGGLDVDGIPLHREDGVAAVTLCGVCATLLLARARAGGERGAHQGAEE